MGHSASFVENMQLVRQMCGPLMRFDASDVAANAGGNSAAAVAASSDSRHIHKQDGLLVALWGQARFREQRLIQLALAEGVAKTLGHDWRERGEKALEGLAGAFSAWRAARTGGELGMFLAVICIPIAMVCYAIVYAWGGRMLI